MSNQQTGRLVIVVGPSGAGKDSIIKRAQTHFKTNTRIDFVRRVITRECNPAAEIHDAVTEEQFRFQQERGDFSVWWHANGLYYGLPNDIHNNIANGQIMIANGSRAALPDIRSTFTNLTIAHITASQSVLRSRLANRDRESAAQIEQRLQRNQTISRLDGDDVETIDNSADLQSATTAFIALIESL